MIITTTTNEVLCVDKFNSIFELIQFITDCTWKAVCQITLEIGSLSSPQFPADIGNIWHTRQCWGYVYPVNKFGVTTQVKRQSHRAVFSLVLWFYFKILNREKKELKMCQTVTQKAFAHSGAYQINGVHTEFLLHKFTNQYFLIITQYEKLNNIFIACNDIALSGIVNSRSLSVKHQFGLTTDEIESSIRFLLNNIQLPNFDKDMEVVVCLGLKEYNGKILKQILSVLNRFGQTE